MNVKQTITPNVTASSNKRMMVFILVLSLSGLENTIAELIPEPTMGPIELGISSFIFLPLALVFLFPYIEAALAVPLGEIVFTEFLLGEFGGLSELSEVILITTFVYVAAQMVHDLTNPRQVFVAAVVAKIGSQIPSALIDVGVVVVGAEELEAVPGLPESIVVIEFVDMIPEAIITGLIFGAIPTMYLVPSLYGKIEPLLGLEPRPRSDASMLSDVGLVHLAALVGASVLAFFVATMGFFLGIPMMETEALPNVGSLLGLSAEEGNAGIFVSLVLAFLIVLLAVRLARSGSSEPAR
ncbi:hypothetical protein ACFQMA_12735 [Halosimplex aquaticum]|uniref:DUF8171 domain-containing protein n=1 Tax=Halosimplex aquaticum TaxID=3026162 RepID=A0ABD5Y4T8_9EURY|nr:hypothetical protein [Halosimplex aquaticum]